MKALFEILPEIDDTDKCVLVCEISYESFSFAIKNEDSNRYVAAAIFQFENETNSNDYPKKLEELIDAKPLLSSAFKRVCIIYSFKESVLIPFNLYSSLENENVINLIHGDVAPATSIHTDLVAAKGVYNAYRVPASFYQLLQSKFPGAESKHQYSALLNSPKTEGDMLFVIFYPNRILVRLVKDGRTELINSFNYVSAEDVSYILLNTCKQFDVSNIPLEIAGLIEKESNLFKEIYKYFEVINFTPLPRESNYSEEILQQPSHYFSHIFAIDSCE
jgi:hypothetical protein